MIRKHFRLKKIALGLAFAALAVAPSAGDAANARSTGGSPRTSAALS